ncbi:hypothetical protein PPS11_03740 [Pseudomonas putida S11]|nr:hypothetical protein PPS11_03740 [Pseudomonas putida S11]
MLIEQGQQRLDHLALQAGTALAEIDDRRAHDRPGLFVRQRRTHATGMAEQGVVRQLAELFVLQRDIAQGAKPRC